MKSREINEIALFPSSTEETLKKLNDFQKDLLQELNDDFKLLPVNHHRNQWMSLGVASFGIPIGVAFGLMVDNLGLLGIRLPIGISIGIAIGTSLDQKVKNEGLHLDFDYSRRQANSAFCVFE